MEGIPLADMIVELRRQLIEAQKQGANEDIKFTLGDIELELRVGTTNNLKAKTGIKFWVVDAGMEGTVDTQKLQTLKLKLSPIGSDGKPLAVSNRDTK